VTRRCVWSRNPENEEAKARYRAVKIQPQWVVTPGKQQQQHDSTRWPSEKGVRKVLDWGHEKSSGFTCDSDIQYRTANHRDRGNSLQRLINGECGLWRKMKEVRFCTSVSLLLTEGSRLRRGGDWIRGHEKGSMCSRKPERRNQTVSSWCKIRKALTYSVRNAETERVNRMNHKYGSCGLQSAAQFSV